MFCNLTRWLISRAEDRGKKMPRFAERHAARCGACREYALFAASLSSRLSGETSEFLAKAPDSPLDPAAWVPEEGAGRGTRAPFRRRFVLHPFPAAAAVLVVAASALVLFLVVRPGPGPGLTSAEKQAVIASLKSVSIAPAEFRGAVAEAESSLARERQILEKSVLSAVEYLQARLNIRVERKEAPKSL